MKKIFAILLAIATVLSFALIGCSNSSTPSTPITLSEDELNSEIAKAFSSTVFVSEEAKEIFDIISSNTQDNLFGHSNVIDYLKNNKYEEYKIGQTWKLGTDCYLVVNPCRILYLSNSTQTLKSSFYLLPNVDTFLVYSNLYKLEDPSNKIPTECIIDDMTYLNGQFFYLGDLLFDAAYLGPYGQITSYIGNSNEVNQFTGTVGNQIWHITEKNHNFDYSIVLIN